jgi:RimJ/RimL family protein N-acetyltransferase
VSVDPGAHVLEPGLPIVTERLRLRAFRPDDFDAVFAMQSRPDVARFLYWRACDARHISSRTSS